MRTYIIRPTRIEGHLVVKCVTDGRKVVDARVSGVMYRGIEVLMRGRYLSDVPFIASRTCGVCSLPHTIASINAIEHAYSITPPPLAIVARNLMYYAYQVYDHILSCIILAGADYAPPHGVIEDLKFMHGKGFMQALKMQRKALEALAIFGGKFPHTSSAIIGGVTELPDTQKVLSYTARFKEIKQWVIQYMIPLFDKLYERYAGELLSGEREANLISYGMIEDISLDPLKRAFKPSVILEGTLYTTDLYNEIEPGINEDITYSYSNEDLSGHHIDSLHSSTSHEKYSFIKAPRFKGYVMETGPLARMWVLALLGRGKVTTEAGEWKPPRKPNTIERIRARAYETAFLCDKVFEEIEKFLDLLRGYRNLSVWFPWKEVNVASGKGLIEASRGALGHWIAIVGNKVHEYRIISPTTWNCSPRDSFGKRGALEDALLNTELSSLDPKIDILRVIRAFDPCMACAVHVTNVTNNGNLEITISS